MKNFLFAFFLFPVMSTAQLIEVSASAGYVFSNALPRRGFNDFILNRYALAMALSGTVKLPYDLRLGLSVAPYRFGYDSWPGDFIIQKYRVYSDPLLLELSVISRNNFGRCVLDLGIAGGIAANRRTRWVSLNEHAKDKEIHYNRLWYTYGLTASCSYSISKRVALGLEIQPKVFVTDIKPKQRTVFLFPAFVKTTVRI